MQLLVCRPMMPSRSRMNSKSVISSRDAWPSRRLSTCTKPEMTVSGPLMSWMMLA